MTHARTGSNKIVTFTIRIHVYTYLFRFEYFKFKRQIACSLFLSLKIESSTFPRHVFEHKM